MEQENSGKNSEEFYRDQTWRLLMGELKAIKSEQAEQRKMLEAINRKWAYVYGIAFGVTVLISAAWQVALAKIKTFIH